MARCRVLTLAFFVLGAVVVTFFGSCTIPPVAFNMMIPAEKMPGNSTEFGLGAGGYTGNAPDFPEPLGFVYYPLWVRANVAPQVDIFAQAHVMNTATLVGAGVSGYLKGFRLTGGIYPLYLETEDGFQAIVDFWPQGSLSYDLTSAAGDSGPVAGSIGVTASRLAVGPVLDLNFHLSTEWAVRTELGVFFPPPWNSREIKGTGVNLSAGLVRTFPPYRR